jgi:hypothetical protein
MKEETMQEKWYLKHKKTEKEDVNKYHTNKTLRSKIPRSNDTIFINIVIDSI